MVGRWLAGNPVPVDVPGEVVFQGHQGFFQQAAGGLQVGFQLFDPFFQVFGFLFLFVEFVLLHDVPEDAHGLEFYVAIVINVSRDLKFNGRLPSRIALR